MYEKMVRIRIFEESLAEAVAAGKLPGAVHLGIGQEAPMVGIVSALKSSDWIAATHREHGVMVARDADMRLMRAELFGKATGYCKGKGGSMHLAVFEKHCLGCNGILGASQAINNGVALALKQKGEGDIAAVIFGDGASNRGEFHEALNLAACWKLPSLAICINNGYGMGGCAEDMCSVEDISARAAGYSIPGFIVDGNDLMAVYEAVSESAKHVRSGKGPALVEIKTTRWRGHFEGDPQLYRTPEMIAEAQKKDGILNFEKELLNQGIATEADIEAARNRAQEALQEAIEFEERSDYPPSEEIYTDLYYEERRAV